MNKKQDNKELYFEVDLTFIIKTKKDLASLSNKELDKMIKKIQESEHTGDSFFQISKKDVMGRVINSI